MDTRMISLPRIRSGLLRNPIDGQVLLYDTRDDKVHLLDPTTACVAELLEEGGWTEPGIVAEIGTRLGITPHQDFLPLAIDQLRNAGLLEEAVKVEPMIDVSRRDMVRKLAAAGIAGLMVPAIATLSASNAYAQSGSGVGTSCAGPGNCASGRCCGGLCRTAACDASNAPCSPAPPKNGSLVDCDCCSGICLSPGNSADRCQ